MPDASAPDAGESGSGLSGVGDTGAGESGGEKSGARSTEVDPRWAASEPALVERIRDEILAAPGTRITFARFMQRALTEPGLGYYASSEIRPTRSGDFLTAPELHPFFGRCLGRFLDAAWQRLRSVEQRGGQRRHRGPERLAVREYGSGRGTLRDTVLAGLSADRSELATAIDWHGIDLPDRADHADRAGDGSDEVAGGESDLGRGFEGVVLANEFLDALPAHRLIVEEGVLRECYVGWEDGWFVETRGELSTAELAAPLDAAGVRLAEGQRAEIVPAAAEWLHRAATGLERGIIVVIDYGHEAGVLYGPRRTAGSLVTYRQHEAGDDPFAAVGHTDITTHVDISALERAAASAGLTLSGSTTQGPFLADLGLGDLLAELGRDPTASRQSYIEARAAVVRLLDPRHLGAFRVLAWERPRRSEAAGGPGADAARLPGFGPTT